MITIALLTDKDRENRSASNIATISVIVEEYAMSTFSVQTLPNTGIKVGIVNVAVLDCKHR